MCVRYTSLKYVSIEYASVGYVSLGRFSPGSIVQVRHWGHMEAFQGGCDEIGPLHHDVSGFTYNKISPIPTGWSTLVLWSGLCLPIKTCLKTDRGRSTACVCVCFTMCLHMLEDVKRTQLRITLWRNIRKKYLKKIEFYGCLEILICILIFCPPMWANSLPNLWCDE